MTTVAIVVAVSSLISVYQCQAMSGNHLSAPRRETYSCATSSAASPPPSLQPPPSPPPSQSPPLPPPQPLPKPPPSVRASVTATCTTKLASAALTSVGWSCRPEYSKLACERAYAAGGHLSYSIGHRWILSIFSESHQWVFGGSSAPRTAPTWRTRGRSRRHTAAAGCCTDRFARAARPCRDRDRAGDRRASRAQ